MNISPRLIAFYLPQFHPVPENDNWWGKGFTEWTNVVKAKPQFRGHYQPRLPADFGFYDLRLPEVREQQALLAEAHGIEGFCYYHYWFGNGRRILERPFNEVVSSGKPDFPFCLCWANESWEGRWYGVTDNSGKVLIRQEYPGEADYEAHFNSLLTAFRDKRYITVNGKPLFQVFRPDHIENISLFITTFRRLATACGLPGIYLVGGQKTPPGWNPVDHGFDAVMSQSFTEALEKGKKVSRKILDILWGNKISYKIFSKDRALNKITFYGYDKIVELMNKTHNEDSEKPYPVFPIVVNDWDNTARAGKKSMIFTGTSPLRFKTHLQAAVKSLEKRPQQERIIFIKSWNEWAEGNYLEPDIKNGMQYLKAVSEVMNDSATN